jgi:hypothetical protein
VAGSTIFHHSRLFASKAPQAERGDAFCEAMWRTAMFFNVTGKMSRGETPPAHQGKFPPAPPSSSASACAAHPVKGRYALRSAALHGALDPLPLLRPSLLTTAAPREISPQARRYKKAGNAVPLSMTLSGSGAFAFLRCSFLFPHACVFVRHHPGRPAYVTCTHAGARYPLRLARGYAPLTPARPAKGSGQAKGKRRKRP